MSEDTPDYHCMPDGETKKRAGKSRKARARLHGICETCAYNPWTGTFPKGCRMGFDAGISATVTACPKHRPNIGEDAVEVA